MKRYKVTTFGKFLKHYQYNPVQFNVWSDDPDTKWSGGDDRTPRLVRSGPASDKNTKLSEVVLIYHHVAGFSYARDGNGTPSCYYDWFEFKLSKMSMWRTLTLVCARENSDHGVGAIGEDYSRLFFQDEADAVNFQLALEERQRQWQT